MDAHSTKKNILCLFILFILAFILYGHTFNFNFLLDDIQQIVTNPNVHNLSHWHLSFVGSTMASQEGINGIYYKPVMMILYNLIWNLGGENPFFFHLFQLLLHTLDAFLVYLIFSKILPSRRYFLSILAGLIFLVHPINSEAVLFIADLQEPLYSFFGLCALLILIRYKSVAAFIASCLLLLLALFSKESGILYIIIAIIYFILFHRNYLKQLLSYVLIAIILYMGLRLGVAELNALHSDNMLIMRSDLITRLFTIPKVLIHYIHLFFYPEALSLTQDWVVTNLTWKDFWLPLIEVNLILFISLYYILKTKNKIFLFFFLWFCIGWSLHSQLIPLDGTVSDRWFYFTIIGLLGMVFVFTENIKLSKKISTIISIIIIVGFSIRTYYRTLNWQNALTLYEHDIKIDPNSFYLNNNLGLELLSSNKIKEAILYFEKTVTLSPERSNAWYTGWQNIGAAYLILHEYDKAEHPITIALQGNNVKPYRAYAWLLQTRGKLTELLRFLEEVALIKFPNDAVLLKIQKSITSNN